MPSLFAELKRRNVFRVGIAYAVASWLVAQVAEMAAGSFGAPQWFMQMLLIVLALGLPVALILAWAFEITPEGIKKEKDVIRSESITPQTGKKLNNVILVLMALAIAYLLFDKFSATAQSGSEPSSQQAAETTANAGENSALAPTGESSEPIITRQSIAVLPFDNRSNREEDEFFVEGVHDDLLTNLAKIGSLKVISRTSVARYKNTESTIPEIARELGVANIMEGAVQRAGNTVRINVQLIDAQTDEHLWAEIFDRELTTDNLFAIQTEISRKIADALEARLSPEEQQLVDNRPTDNLAAYSAYLRGRQLVARRTAETVDQALIEFQRAVELDPQFALAWAGIAEAARLSLQVSDMNRPEAIQLSQEAVDKAMAINDRLGEVQLARARLIGLKAGDSEEMEEALKLAIELSPGYAEAWQAYSGFVMDVPGRLHEALDLAEKAAELDPLSTAIQNQVIYVLSQLGEFDVAEQRLSRLIEQDPDFAASYEEMSGIKSELGQFDEAILWSQRAQALDPGNIGYAMREMWPQMDMGNDAELDRLLARMEVMDPDSSTLSFMELFINIYRRNYDAALEAARLFDQKTGYRPLGRFPQIWVQSIQNDQASFREIGAEIMPDYFDRKTFQKALEWRPEVSCRVAWSLAHTGDEALGVELARQAVEYKEKTLPGGADNLSNAMCFMVLDQPDEALRVIEKAVNTGRFSGWWMEFKHPAFELLRQDLRFIAAEGDIQSRIARQRENLARMKTEAGS